MKSHTFTLPEKFSEKHVGTFIDNFYKVFKKKEKTLKYIFDFSYVKWIANQELLVFTSLLKTLVNENVDFHVQFLARATGQDLDERRLKNIIQIWETWKIFQIIPDDNYSKYFDINGNNIDTLRRNFSIPYTSSEIYDRYGVTPFVSLEYIKDFDDRKIGEMLADVYKLNRATSEILQINHCYMPFENQTLGSIVTKELYENFLDHYEKGLFKSDNKNAFLCIALNRKLKGNNPALLAKNFEEESIPELKNFYKKHGTYRNRSILQLSFTDFGAGIPITLKNEFLKKKGLSDATSNEIIDSNILEYAFEFDSSRNPLAMRYSERAAIPRGLFDLLSIIKRFNGLIVIRSNFGKIFYDFSEDIQEIKASRFSDNNNYFPGTLISIYLPERASEIAIESTVIKPIISHNSFSTSHAEKKIISLYTIQKKLHELAVPKTELYTKILEELVEQVGDNQNTPKILYVDFKDYELDERITRKIIYFLISDYKINIQNNVIITNPPPLQFLKQMQDEIELLSSVSKDYIIHPLPFVDLHNNDQLTVFWLGVYDDNDISRLNDLLFEMHSLRNSDFHKPNNIVGNVNYYDNHGNLKSFLDREKLIEVFKEVNKTSFEYNISSILKDCILKNENQIFLCSGNYYQEEYLQMYDALSDETSCDYLSKSLGEKLKVETGPTTDKFFLSLTPNSTKIAQSLVRQGFINPNQLLLFEDYDKFIETCSKEHSVVPENASVILLCDVTSTGYLTESIEKSLHKFGANLLRIGVLINAIDKAFEADLHDYEKMFSNLTALHINPIKKFRRIDIKSKLIDGKTNVIRIDPYTFSPVLNSLPHTVGTDDDTSAILLSTEEFIDLIPDKYMKAGYFRFNSLIHPYFFDMGAALQDPDSGLNLLTKIFDKLPDRLLDEISTIFYPKNSGISKVDFNLFKNKIFRKHSLEIHQLDRYGTNDGWRFPLLPSPLQKREYSTVMILDDGSCTGESMIQMINEVSSLTVKKIVVISLIGRVSDHKKDFFSKIRMLKSPNSDNSNISLQIYFGSHWHIPTYYIEESPVVIERNWLDSLLSYPNLPISIRTIAENVLSELSVKEITGNSNKFLIKKRDGKDIIKDLILKKDEIGKISSYHLYRDYFVFFDDIIKTYEENKDFEERYQKIELVCAVFLHEPYLFARIKRVLPDLTEKIEEFIQTILFGNPGKEGNPKLPKEKLYHQWSNKNLIHLMFIVFYGDKLTSLLNYDKFKSLIEEFCKSDNDLSYLLFKLLGYYPIGRFDIRSDFHNTQILELLNLIIDRNEIDAKTIKSLKRFRTFTLSLASTDSFDVLYTNVKHNYRKLIDDEAHRYSMTLQRDIFVTQIEELKKDFKPETETVVVETWDKISTFIEDLLSFSKSFPEFFLPCEERIYNKLENQKDSLRSLFGEINEIISTLKPSSNFERALDIIRLIYEGFIVSGSEYFKIFVDDYKPVILEELKKFIENLKSKGFEVECPDLEDADNLQPFVIHFPTYFIHEILLGEMLENFRHSDQNKPVIISLASIEGFLVIKFESVILPVSQSGGGSGLARLEKLNKMPNQTVAYLHITDGQIFNQTLKFKII
ncbi:Uncharacterised protein [Sphingobacterium multivorum]|uniref:hypothetical protein n=1 Tax=Sphingobacterium multivorum TaxID=28454 RepID=UPI000E010BFE|nr:hypothetical protein [Sphingobacterium multivorum]QQT46108.1 hypothetical protein I6J00_05415 [Sphingobacterium multivorum]SUJ31137.1 Uncharacterised protein [Sphingobacterium multivorum]